MLTVSEASKRDILRYFRVPAAKIDVIYNAIDERFGEPPDDEEVARVRERYQLNDPFVLYAGNIKPHKNLERLIEAFQIAAEGGPRARQAADHRRRDLEVRDAAPRRAPLQAAQARAVLRLRPRQDAGRAVPARRACSCSRRCTRGSGSRRSKRWRAARRSSRRTCRRCPEVVGDAALLIDPYEPDAIAAAMRRVLTEPALREDLRARGLARVREFSWERSVRRVREIYGEVLAE